MIFFGDKKNNKSLMTSMVAMASVVAASFVMTGCGNSTSDLAATVSVPASVGDPGQLVGNVYKNDRHSGDKVLSTTLSFYADASSSSGYMMSQENAGYSVMNGVTCKFKAANPVRLDYNPMPSTGSPNGPGPIGAAPGYLAFLPTPGMYGPNSWVDMSPDPTNDATCSQPFTYSPWFPIPGLQAHLVTTPQGAQSVVVNNYGSVGGMFPMGTVVTRPVPDSDLNDISFYEYNIVHVQLAHGWPFKYGIINSGTNSVLTTNFTWYANANEIQGVYPGYTQGPGGPAGIFGSVNMPAGSVTSIFLRQ